MNIDSLKLFIGGVEGLDNLTAIRVISGIMQEGCTHATQPQLASFHSWPRGRTCSKSLQSETLITVIFQSLISSPVG